jgi:type I restriction enzyme S subunit
MPDIEQFRCPLPPTDEQKAISSYLWRQSERVDRLVAKTQHSIALLKERRSAFITAAVTGQIDLREEA